MAPINPLVPIGARALYMRWSPDRDAYLRRARQCALLTIPSLFPPEGWTSTSDLPTPWQGIGERGLRNLASRLLMTLLPVNAPLVKMGLHPAAALQLRDTATKGDFDNAFSVVEQTIGAEVEAAGSRVPMFETIKQLLVAGNALTNFTPDGSIRTFRLDTYVCRRDASGKARMIILHRKLDRDGVDPQILLAVGEMTVLPSTTTADDSVDVYTVIRRDDASKLWRIHQEINDKIVPESVGSDPLDSPSWVSARMMVTTNEHYGRGYVEEMLGDLQSYEGLSRHMIEGAAAMAKLLIVRKPGSSITAKDLKKPNLSIVTGKPDDISTVSLDKYGDFRVALELSRDIRERLEHSFLLKSAIQRDAERVTAEEIRTMAAELDEGLGGIYSSLGQEVQRPFVVFQVRRARDENLMPAILADPKKVRLTLTTGLQALGRSSDLSKLRGALNDLASVGQLAETLPELNREEAASRIFAAWGVNKEDLLKSAQDVAAEQQQKQMMEQIMPLLTQLAQSGSATQLTKAATEQPQET